ncbi:TIGR03915 family putative DNA repair protein [Pedobacter sp. SD-b]|uniref:TIGR03915 family putative DNA repair protein n=1 Tax=Pedobacter segetis TaxID=2793069 RepID=A0ABS1BPR3_9SPHI|nr:TIGR03915 family putative DNA repair protein [Pedobacter segetis]MBK0384354.1 TIGR03915 family putative DNA repair protein [Pedobacter segetis]
MYLLTYDHSVEGFFSAVFEAYERKLKNVVIRKQGLPMVLFTDGMRRVSTNPRKAERVYVKLKALMGELGIQKIIYSLLTEEELCEGYIFDVIKYALANPKVNVMKDMSHPSVLKLAQYTKSVHREKHRMEAFVRFKLTCDDIYYADIEPDFNVLPIIAKHFKSRYQDQKWLIFDQKRSYGIYYDLYKLEIIQMKFNRQYNREEGLEMLKKDEPLYQSLWRTYYAQTNIRLRKNMRLHLLHVPKRYWKYLTEKIPEY